MRPAGASSATPAAFGLRNRSSMRFWKPAMRSSQLVPSRDMGQHYGMTVDGLVLAGGRGRRLGRPKAGLVVARRTLVERAVDILVPRCDRVVVVGRADVP